MKWSKKKILFKIRFCDILSLALGALTVFSYLWFQKPWFVSVLLSVCIMGSLMKLFKIASLKNALIFFVPWIIINVLSSIYLAIYVRYEWDNVTIKYFNSPLLL